MREDADANHIHEHVQVQDEMEESVTGYHSLAYGPARVQISAMLRLKVMRSPVN